MTSSIRGGPPRTQARRLIPPPSRQPRLVGRLCVVASPIPQTQICPFARPRRCQAERREGACRPLGARPSRTFRPPSVMPSLGIALMPSAGATRRDRLCGQPCRASGLARYRRSSSPESVARFRLQSHSPGFAGVRRDPMATVFQGHGRPRPDMNAEAHCWKACWGQPLRSSNLLSSATLTCRNTQ